MKPIPESWKSYFLILSVIVLVLTVVGDQYRRPSPDPAIQNSIHSHPEDHSHDPSKTREAPTSLDKAFGEAPDPATVPRDPVREHRMAIFHYNEGNKFLNRGNWKEAVGNYQMALHHDPALEEVYINMSNAYLKGQQYPEAKQTLDQLKSRVPDNPHLFYNLACYYSLTHQEADSLTALQNALRLGYPNPGDVNSDPDLENLRRTSEFKAWQKTLQRPDISTGG